MITSFLTPYDVQMITNYNLDNAYISWLIIYRTGVVQRWVRQ